MPNDTVEGFEWVDLGFGPSDYEGNDPWKVELHMTQGDSIEGAEGAFRPYPPHLSCEYEGRKKHQYISLNKAAAANLGSHNDRSHVIQLEIVGHSENAEEFWPEELDWIGTDVLAPLKRAGIDFALQAAPQGFHGAGEGIKPYLATPQSPIRFPNDAALDAFSGICGHQHMPPPDDHWDPGLLDTWRMLVACSWSLGQNPEAPPVWVPVAPDAGPPPPPSWYKRLLYNTGDPRNLLFGWDIARAQQKLIEQGHGYATTVDGWYGSDTEHSVRSFQSEQGLDVDGKIGPDTSRALGE